MAGPLGPGVHGKNHVLRSLYQLTKLALLLAAKEDLRAFLDLYVIHSA